MFTALDGNTEDEESLSVSKVMQWLSGQAHRHLLLSERQAFKITVLFDHTCMERMPDHRICYPVVSACTQTITCLFWQSDNKTVLFLALLTSAQFCFVLFNWFALYLPCALCHFISFLLFFYCSTIVLICISVYFVCTYG